MQLTKNFNLSEFACHDGTVVPEKYISNVRLLTCNLQIIRNYINEKLDRSTTDEVKIQMVSGFRTKNWNIKVGGAEDSWHIKAGAGDIKALDPYNEFTIDDLDGAISELRDAGKIHDGGYKKYNSFIHYDIRPNPARW